MTRRTPSILATWLLSLFLPESEKETLAGDLVEEYHLIVSTLGRHYARRWYWGQVIRSAAPLLWAGIRRGNWLKTVGAVIAGYSIVVLLVMVSDLVIFKLFSFVQPFYVAFSLIIAFPVMLVGGYLVARIRLQATTYFTVFVTLMGFVSLAVTGDKAPLWYQISLILIAPIASLLGRRIYMKTVQIKVV